MDLKKLGMPLLTTLHDMKWLAGERLWSRITFLYGPYPVRIRETQRPAAVYLTYTHIRRITCII